MIHQTVFLREHFRLLDGCSDAPTLTVYLPDNLEEMGRTDMRRPCLLICPGGAYLGCSAREAEPVVLHFLPLGFNVFVLNYSVAPYHFPAQLCEVAAALELIYQHAADWHCDTEKVAIMGFSAGGHLAAHYSLAYDCAEVRALFPQSKAVQATLLCYPVITADPAWAHIVSIDALTGKKDRTDAENAKFSCEKLVSDKTPPTFLWHTSADEGVPVMNSLLYAQALAAHGVRFELHVYPHGRHGLATCDAQTCEVPVPPEIAYDNAWLDCAKKWLSTVF